MNVLVDCQSGTDIARNSEKSISQWKQVMQRINQFGFTLFEITTAIVIICLLASFMVIGQKLTINVKVNRLDRDLNSIRAAIYDAQDRLSPMRSNFRKSSSHLPDTAGLSDNCNLNAIIGGYWKSASGETFNLWKNIWAAGFDHDSTNNSNVYAPLKSSGGTIGVSEASNPPIAGLNGNYIICTNNIAGTLVKQLDFVMDDGNTNSGTMIVSNKIGGTGIATDNISNSATYVICLSI